MSVRNFCDICGEPAEVGVTSAGSIIAHSMDGNSFVVRTSCGFSNHPTGFGGPPDLCRKCFYGLLVKLAEAQKPRA